jgi:hypothetical protein
MLRDRNAEDCHIEPGGIDFSPFKLILRNMSCELYTVEIA